MPADGILHTIARQPKPRVRPNEPAPPKPEFRAKARGVNPLFDRDPLYRDGGLRGGSARSATHPARFRRIILLGVMADATLWWMRRCGHGMRARGLGAGSWT